MVSSKEERLDECAEHFKEFKKFRNKIISEMASILSEINEQNLDNVFKLTSKVSEDLIALGSECENAMIKEFGEEEVAKRIPHFFELLSIEDNEL